MLDLPLNPPFRFSPCYAMPPSTKLPTKHKAFFLKTFLGEVFYFSFFLCISNTLCIFANEIIFKQTIK